MAIRCGLVAGIFSAISLTFSAQADQPAIRFEEGSLISPSAANQYYTNQPGGLSARSAKASFDPRITELSIALSGDPVQIDAYIREHIESTPHFGLQKGAVGAYLDRAGTAFDQAELMVDLIRASGGQARYIYGAVSMTSAQIRDAFGLSASVNLTDFFADGGVPATVGSTSTFAHVWVEAQVAPGDWRVFDPFLKAHVWHEGRNLPGYMAFNAAQATSTLLSGSSTGSSSGVPWRQGVSSSAAESLLNSTSNAMLDALETDAQLIGIEMTEFVGGRELTGDALVAASSASHPFATSQTAVWTGDIPNALRTQIRIFTPTLSAGIPIGELYLDEVYGSRITLGVFALNGSATLVYNQDPNIDPTSFETRLYAGHTALSQLDDRTEVTQYTQTLPNDFLVGSFAGQFGGTVRLELDAPYAAALGSFMDMTRTQIAYDTSLSEIFVGAGVMTRHHTGAYEGAARSEAYRAHYDNEHELEVRDMQNIEEVSITRIPSPEQFYWQHPQIRGLEMSLDRDFYWRRWGAQREHISRIISARAGADIRHHFSMGVVTGGGDVNGPNLPVLVTSHRSALTPVWIDAVTTASIGETRTGARMDGARRAYSVMSSLLEQSVIEVAFERTRAGSWESRALSALLEGNGRYLQFPANGFNAALLSGSYSSQAIAAMQAYSNDGYAVVVSNNPEDADGGRFAVYSSNAAETALAQIYARDDLTASGAGTAVRKGGGAQAADVMATIRPPEIASPEVARDEAAPALSLGFDVSLSNGVLSYSPGPDVMAGPADAAFGLSFQRQYSSNGGHGSMGAGWTHNWDLKASVSSGASHLVDSTNPRLMAPTIAAAEIMVTVGEQAGLMDGLLANAQIAQTWLNTYALRSLVTVQAGSGESLFVRLADGSFRNLSNNYATLTETVAGGDYPNEDYLFRDRDGAELLFEAVVPFQLGGRLGSFLEDVYPATRWTLPTGVVYTIEYREKTGVIERVSNSFGWQLEFTSDPDVCSSVPGYQYEPGREDGLQWDPILSGFCRALTNSFQLIRRVRASHQTTPSVFEEANYTYTGFTQSNLPYQVRLHRAQTPATGADVMEFGYDIGTLINAHGTHAPVLSEIYRPGETTHPFLRIDYARHRGRLSDRVREVRHRVNDAATPAYESSTFLTTGVSGSSADPLGYTGFEYYDREGQLVRSVSPRQVLTTNWYDGLGRLIETQTAYQSSPQSYESRTTFAYDALDNRIEERVHPRAGMSGSPLITSYAYGDANWPHKPTSVTDPRGQVSTTTYYPATGLVHIEQGPSGERVEHVYTPQGLLSEIRTRVEN